MNFGVGAGDVFSVTMVAWNLYRRCKSANPEFNRVADDLKNLHIVLKDIEETVSHDATGMSRTRAARLEGFSKDARAILNQLTEELNKYGKLDTRTQKKWEVLRWGMADISDIKLRLISLTTNLNAFSHTITHAAHSRIESLVMKILDEVGKGFHADSVLSEDSIATKESWHRLRKELEELGIDKHVLNEKRTFIVEVIKRAKSDGTIEEEDIPEMDGEDFGDNDVDDDIENHDSDGEYGSDFDTNLSTTRTLICEPTLSMVDGEAMRSEIEQEWSQRVERLKLDNDSVSNSIDAHPRSARAQNRPKAGRRRLSSFFRKLIGAEDLRVLEAADSGDLEGMLNLIEQKANLKTTDKWDWTALHMAAYGGYDEMVRVLIEVGADLDARTVDDETPRALAEIKGRVGVVRIIDEEEIRRANKAKAAKARVLKAQRKASGAGSISS